MTDEQWPPSWADGKYEVTMLVKDTKTKAYMEVTQLFHELDEARNAIGSFKAEDFQKFFDWQKSR